MAQDFDPECEAIASVLAGIIHRVSLVLQRDNPELQPVIDRHVDEIRDRLHSDRWNLEHRLQETLSPEDRKRTQYHLDIVQLLHHFLDHEGDPDLVKRLPPVSK